MWENDYCIHCTVVYSAVFQYCFSKQEVLLKIISFVNICLKLLRSEVWRFLPSPNKECDTSSVGEDTNTTSSTNYSSCIEVTTPSEETPLPSTSVGGQIHGSTANSGNFYYDIALPRVFNHVLHERLVSLELFSIQESVALIFGMVVLEAA